MGSTSAKVQCLQDLIEALVLLDTALVHLLRTTGEFLVISGDDLRINIYSIRDIDLVEDDAIIIAESQLVQNLEVKDGVKVVYIPATEIAENLNNPKGMSVVVAGAVVAAADLFPYDVAVDALVKYFEDKHLPVEVNKTCFIEGYNYIKNYK